MNQPSFRMSAVLLIAACFLINTAESVEPDSSNSSSVETGRFNLKMPTIGGKQFWTDELVFRDWRIQRHAITGHYRLLDEENQRRAWGDFQQCRQKLEQLKRKLELPPVEGRVVIALHGVVRSRSSMDELCEFLRDKGGYTTLNVSYASTRAKLGDHAAALARIIEYLDPTVTEINFIAHSMGNIVIRRYLHDVYASGKKSDSRIHRIVMLAPPNNGSKVAEFFRSNVVFEWVWGESTMQLAEDWEGLQTRLAVPHCQFGIIAGGSQDSTEGLNALLKGNDDFVVSVQETRLPGARDFAVLPVYHGTIMNDPQGREYALRFFHHGHFVSERQRQPIPVAVKLTDEAP